MDKKQGRRAVKPKNKTKQTQTRTINVNTNGGPSQAMTPEDAVRYIQQASSGTTTLSNGTREVKISFGPSRPPVETMPSMAEAAAISQSNISKLTGSNSGGIGNNNININANANANANASFAGHASLAGVGASMSVTSSKHKKKKTASTSATDFSTARNATPNPFGLPMSSTSSNGIKPTNINPFAQAHTQTNASGTSISFGSLDLEALKEGVALATGAVKSAAAKDASGLPCNEAEMKALVSMFVEIMGMSAVDASNAAAVAAEMTKETAKNGKKKKGPSSGTNNSTSSSSAASGSPSGGSGDPVFMFGSSGGGNVDSGAIAANAAGLASAAASLLPNGLASIPPPPGGWTEGAIDQMAAATAGFFSDSASWEALRRTYGGLAASQDASDGGDDSSLPDLDDMRDVVRGQQKAAAVAAAAALTSNYRLSPMEQAAAASALASAASGSSIPGKVPGDSSNNASNGDVAWDSWEQVAIEEALEVQEKSRKAAKKREKKQKRKAKAKEEAAQKAVQAAQKKREKAILSWRSRVVSACQSNEVAKLEALLQESPLLRNKSNDASSSNSSVQDDSGGNSSSSNQSVIIPHLEFLLPNSIAKSRSQLERGKESRERLADYILDVHVPIAFAPLRTGRTALHTACFNGDVSFVELVLKKASKYDDASSPLPDSYLDVTCSDSGWAPLHYAVVSASGPVLETLLARGCDVSTITDDTHTWRESDGEGITAHELVSHIHAGTYEKEIESHGVALQEMENTFFSSQSDRRNFLKTVERAMKRLEFVEANGYTPPDTNTTEKLSDDATNDEQQEESVAAKKRKKKKKKKQQQQGEAESSSVAISVDTAQSSAGTEQLPKNDPTVVALLGMGFTEEQIRDAAKACGGINRATADDLIAWIFGQDVPQESVAISAENSAESSRTTLNEEEPEVIVISQPKVDLAEEKRREDAAREQEAARERLAAAERLAAKREEKRRRNREWNSREQVRQQEEAKAKMAKSLAPPRIAARPVAAQLSTTAAKMGPGHQGGFPGATSGQFRTNVALTGNPAGRSGVTPRQILTHPRNNPGADAKPPAAARPGPQTGPNMQFSVPVQTATKSGHPNMRGPPSRIAYNNSVSMDDDRTVSSLGSARSRAHSVSSLPAPPAAAPPGFRHSTATSGLAMPHNMMTTPLPPHMGLPPHLMPQTVPPVQMNSPILPNMPSQHQQAQSLPQQQLRVPPGDEIASDVYSADENPMGEIRATAKAFVPSNFTMNLAPSAAQPSAPAPAPSPPEAVLNSGSSHSRSAVSSFPPRQTSRGGALGVAVQNSIEASATTTTAAATFENQPEFSSSSMHSRDSKRGHSSLLPALSSSLNAVAVPASSLVDGLIPMSADPSPPSGIEDIPLTSSLGFALEASSPSSAGNPLVGSSLLDSITSGPTISGSSIWGASEESPKLPPSLAGLSSFSFGDADREANVNNDGNPLGSSAVGGISGFGQSWAFGGNNNTNGANAASREGSIW